MKIRFCLLLVFTVIFASSKNIIVKKGEDSFNIELEVNAGTGYNWFLEKYDGNLITPSKVMYKDNSEQLGGIVKTTWQFKVKHNNVPTMSNIVFRKARPWEQENNEVSNFTIFIP